jgi:hypothetical protein
LANADITVKMVVPACGNFELMDIIGAKVNKKISNDQLPDKV